MSTYPVIQVNNKPLVRAPGGVSGRPPYGGGGINVNNPPGTRIPKVAHHCSDCWG